MGVVGTRAGLVLAAAAAAAAVGLGQDSSAKSFSSRPTPSLLLAFSADIKHHQQLVVLRAVDGKYRVLASYPASNGWPQWSPGGRTLVFMSDRGGSYDLWRVRPDGSALKRLTVNDDDERDITQSPQGTVAFSALRARFGSYDIYAMGSDAKGRRRVTRDDSHDLDAAWSPSGRSIAFIRICTGGPCYPGSDDRSGDLYVVGADGGKQHRLTRTSGADSDPRWSPNGSRIAYVSKVGKNSDIWVVRPDGSGRQRLTSSRGADDDPQWSPDGRKIAFVSTRGGSADVYVMKADGTGERNLTRKPGYDGVPRWSPDGNRIFFISSRFGLKQAFVMTPNGAEARRLATLNTKFGDLVVSPTRSAR